MRGKTIEVGHNSEAFRCHFSTIKEDSFGVIVLHAWWGLNDFISSFCDRLAQEGCSAIAPDLYTGRIALTVQQAEEFSFRLDSKEAFRKINATLDYLLSHRQLAGGRVGVIGFSLGGYFALDMSLARKEVRAVTVFYATSPTREWSRSEAYFLGHFAEKDPYEPAANVLELEKSLKSADKNVQFYTYPHTGHWFFESDRSEAYDPAAADLAWKRTLEFIRTSLGDR